MQALETAGATHAIQNGTPSLSQEARPKAPDTRPTLQHHPAARDRGAMDVYRFNPIYVPDRRWSCLGPDWNAPVVVAGIRWVWTLLQSQSPQKNVFSKSW